MVDEQSPAAPRLATFPDCVFAAWNTPEFVEQYRRLTGAKLGSDFAPPRSGIEAMIDRATGNRLALDEVEVVAFFDFVLDAAWDRLPLEMRDPAWVATLADKPRRRW